MIGKKKYFMELEFHLIVSPIIVLKTNQLSIFQTAVFNRICKLSNQNVKVLLACVCVLKSWKIHSRSNLLPSKNRTSKNSNLQTGIYRVIWRCYNFTIIDQTLFAPFFRLQSFLTLDDVQRIVWKSSLTLRRSVHLDISLKASFDMFSSNCVFSHEFLTKLQNNSL